MILSYSAGAEALIFQNINLKNLLLATVKGFKISMLTTPGFDPATAAPQIIKLLNRGGMVEIKGNHSVGILRILLCRYYEQGRLPGSSSAKNPDLC